MSRFLTSVVSQLGRLGATVDDAEDRGYALAPLHNRGSQSEDLDERERGEGEHQVRLDDVREAGVAFESEDVGGVPEEEGVAGEEEELGRAEGNAADLAPDEAAAERLLELLAVELQHLLAAGERHDGVHVGHGFLEHPPSAVVCFPHVT